MPTLQEIQGLTWENFEPAEGYINCNGSAYPADDYFGFYNYYWYKEGEVMGLLELYPGNTQDIGIGYDDWNMLIKCVAE